MRCVHLRATVGGFVCDMIFRPRAASLGEVAMIIYLRDDDEVLSDRRATSEAIRYSSLMVRMSSCCLLAVPDGPICGGANSVTTVKAIVLLITGKACSYEY